MSTSLKQRKTLKSHRSALAIAAALVLGTTVIVPSANAAPAPVGSLLAESSAPHVVPGPLEESDEVVQEVQKIIDDAGGGGILQTYETQYRPVSEEPAGEFAALNFPDGCRISGVIYFTFRLDKPSSVYNEGNTFCPGATNIQMDLEIIKQDLVFFTLEPVAFNRSRAAFGPELQSEAEYSCPTGNLSGFKGVSDGILTLGDTAYVAYEETPDFARFDCG